MEIPYAERSTPRYSQIAVFLRENRWIVTACVLFVMAFFAVAVYPTLYRYETVNETYIRINRFSGKAEQLTRFGWYDLKPDPTPPAGYQLEQPPKL